MILSVIARLKKLLRRDDSASPLLAMAKEKKCLCGFIQHQLA